MSTAEIEYVVPADPDHQSDQEDIIAAMGAYQNEIPFGTFNEVNLNEEDGQVIIRLSREALRADPERQTPEAIAELEEEMRAGIERHRNAQK